MNYDTLCSIHEAAHAVVALKVGFLLESAVLKLSRDTAGYIELIRKPLSILAYDEHPDGSFAPVTQYAVDRLIRRELHRHRVTLLAGLAIEMIYNPAEVTFDHARHDLSAVNDTFTTEQEFGEALPSLLATARRFLVKHWIAVHAVADELKERRVLTGEEIRAIVQVAGLARP